MITCTHKFQKLFIKILYILKVANEKIPEDGSYYLGIEVIDYLLVASEFITYHGNSTCRLEAKIIGCLPTSL